MSFSVNAMQPGQQPSAATTVTKATAGTPADNPRLSHAAHEFEASLMKEFLKPLEHDSLFSEKGDDDGDNDDDGGDGSTSTLMSYGSEALAMAISERGGFGIATKILDHFRTSHATTPTKASAENKDVS